MMWELVVAFVAWLTLFVLVWALLYAHGEREADQR